MPDLSQGFGEDCGASDAVDVVVAVDRDGLAAIGGECQAIDCRRPVAEHRGISGLVPLGIEKLLRCGDGVDASLPEQTSDE